MSIGIYTSPNMLQASRIYSGIVKQLDSATDNIVSGKRVNEAADDAASLTISSRMNTKLKSMISAVTNNQQNVDMLNTFDIAAEAMQEGLLRMRSLAIYSNNGAKDNNNRALLDVEYQLIKDKVISLATNTTYNNINFHQAIASTFTFQAGIDVADLKSYTSTNTFITSSTSLNATSISTQANAGSAMTDTWSFSDDVIAWRQEVANRQQYFSMNSERLEDSMVKMKISRGRIVDADMAQEVKEMMNGRIRRDVSVNMMHTIKDNLLEVSKLISDI